MRAGAVVLVAGAGLLALGGIAYASEHHGDNPPLPPPAERCTTATDVGTATSSMLADSTIPATQLRTAANVLRTWDHYCDDQARQAGQTSALLLDQRAAQLEGQSPSPLPGGQPPSPWGGFPIPGMVGSQHSVGLHGESGTLYWYANGDEWFVPDSPMLVPYYIPGGSNELPHPTTTGACCGSCARGDECETGCEG